MIQIEKIRQEIERRRLHFNKEAEKYQALNNGYSQNCYGARDALRDLENFLDTLSEEPDKSLEEEYKDYVENDPVYSKLVNGIAGLGIARHFAEWQKEQDLAEMAQSKSPLSVAYANRCFENGKQAMKEQMLKDAVEATVMATKCGDKYQQLLITDWNSSDGLHNGDKVRIVVLKEEEDEK